MPMKPEYNQLESLLKSTKTLVENQKKDDTEKGLNFNIFSVLKMETKENETHSAFLRELLNPKGSHGKGDLFLGLFLKQLKDNRINIKTSIVTTEKYVGKKDIENKTGGKIDLFISDQNGNSVSIENKIYARDQIAQIERYYNHNKEQNKVYYLTLHGDEPSDESKGGLIAGKDFLLISYKTDISNWLRNCITAANNSRRLKETIEQYLQLIQKLTFTMENKYENELTDLMIANFESASFIHANFESAKNYIADKFRKDFFNELNSILDSSVYEIEIGDEIHTEYAQVWVSLKDVVKSNLFIGIESFNGGGHLDGQLFIGIFYPFDKSINKRSDFFNLEENTPTNNWWTNKREISPLDGLVINFGNPVLLSKIHLDKSFRTRLIEYIVNEAKEYVYEHSDRLIEYERRM